MYENQAREKVEVDSHRHFTNIGSEQEGTNNSSSTNSKLLWTLVLLFLLSFLLSLVLSLFYNDTIMVRNETSTKFQMDMSPDYKKNETKVKKNSGTSTNTTNTVSNGAPSQNNSTIAPTKTIEKVKQDTSQQANQTLANTNPPRVPKKPECKFHTITNDWKEVKQEFDKTYDLKTCKKNPHVLNYTYAGGSVQCSHPELPFKSHWTHFGDHPIAPSNLCMFSSIS